MTTLFVLDRVVNAPDPFKDGGMISTETYRLATPEEITRAAAALPGGEPAGASDVKQALRMLMYIESGAAASPEKCGMIRAALVRAASPAPVPPAPRTACECGAAFEEHDGRPFTCGEFKAALVAPAVPPDVATLRETVHHFEHESHCALWKCNCRVAGQIAALDRLVALASARSEDTAERYWELIYAVGMKHAGETRHETALRYLRQAEENLSGPPDAARAPLGATPPEAKP